MKAPSMTQQPRGALGGARLAAAVVGLALLVAAPLEKLDHEFHHNTAPVPDTGAQDKPRFTRSVLHIYSHGDRLEAWLYLPKHSPAPPPVVIMAHGMGAQKDIGLWMYAERFVEAGMAVLAFDYRCFGGSEGQPRHWVSPRRHLQDFEAVVKHVQATDLGGAVDGRRVALWGVSYAGGHVLVTAARFGANISAVVANEPYVSPAAVLHTTAARGVRRTLRLLAVGISDELRRLLARLGFSLPPVYLRLVAPMADPNALALLPLQDSEMAIRANAAPPKRQGGWQNKVLARVVIEALGYNPAKHLGRVTAPLFVRVALKDHLIPAHVIRGALEGAGLPQSQYIVQERDVTHIEAHATGVKEEAIRPVIAFLRRHLGLAWHDEAARPDAALEGAAQGGQPKEGLSAEAGEGLAEVQFPEA